MPVVETMNSKRATDELRQANTELEHFYLEAKRNKRLAKWAATQLGLDPKAYFLKLVECDLTKAGPKPVVDRILADFAAANLALNETDVWAQLRKCEQTVLLKMLDKQAAKTEAAVRKDLSLRKKKKRSKHKK